MPSLAIKPASSCTSHADRNGVVTPAGSATWGIFQAIETGPPPAPNPDWRVISSSANCSYNSGNFANVKNDVVALTKAGASNEKDVNGNSLTGYKTPVNRDGAGLIRIDDATTMTNAGINALDNAAKRVRTESTANNLNVITYAIGLGGPGAAEDVLLQRVANTAASPIYNVNEPVGLYVYASDASKLQQAFSSIASDILRLAK
jgi:hypothetical protein